MVHALGAIPSRSQGQTMRGRTVKQPNWRVTSMSSDSKTDPKSLKTIPQRIGITKTKIFGLLLLTLYFYFAIVIDIDIAIDIAIDIVIVF